MNSQRRMREQIAQQPPLKRRQSADQARRTGNGASPHYAGHYAGFHPEDAPYQSSQLSRGKPQSEDEFEEEEEIPDSFYPQPMPPTSRKYRSTNEQEIIRGNRRLVIHQGPPPRQKRRMHPLLIFGIVFAVIIAGVILLSRAEIWWENQQNQWAYGYPRLYQTDAKVGHEDSQTPSHFIAENLHGHILIIEFPGDNLAHAKIYIGPELFGDGDDLVPVTVSFQDVNGDGKVDMLIHLQGQTIIFLNTGTEFIPASK